MKTRTSYLVLAVIAGFIAASWLHCKTASAATIQGYVLLPKDIEPGATEKESKVFIYLKDYSPRDGQPVFPWTAPIKKVAEFDINSLSRHRLAFRFQNLPEGQYGISVLIDTGRPHVPPGSTNFTAFPGDYTGGTRQNIQLGPNQSIEVTIEEGLYVTVPDGYQAPLYSPE